MPIQLNLGCGLIHRPAWINLDLQNAAAADLRADALLLPFPDRSVASIDACQLVEHLGYVGTLYALCEWARVLAPGSTLRIETPDRDATLQAVTAKETADAALPWVFGTERKGQGHRYLFCAEELVQMVAAVGFESVQVEPVLASLGHPTFGLTARRSADTPAIRFYIDFHRLILQKGILDPTNVPPVLAALETIAEKAACLVNSPSADSLARLVSLSVRYSPLVTACILEALPDPLAWPAAELAQVRFLVEGLAESRFPARLACRWRTLSGLPGTTSTAWARLEREVSLYLSACLCPDEGLDEIKIAFDAVTADLSPSDLSVDIFSRTAMVELSRCLTAGGVRAYARHGVGEAVQTIELALRYDPDSLWARWNLARLYLCQDRRLDALAQYEMLLENLPQELGPVFVAELEMVTGRSDGLDRITVPLSDPRDLLEAIL
jgi:predicted SAM-dependent methyltransferase